MLQVMWKNYWTTFVGAALAGLYYLDQIGTKLPTTSGEWLHVGVGLGLAVLGFVAKSATVGSVPPSVKVLACALLLGGCASFEKAPADIELPSRPEGLISSVGPESLLSSVKLDLAKFTGADLDQAIAMASAAKDAGAPYRLRCYTTLRKYVVDASVASPPPVAITGVVSAYERVAELDASARQGLSAVPADIHADCAVLGLNAAEFAMRVGLKFAPLPGAAAVGGVLR